MPQLSPSFKDLSIVVEKQKCTYENHIAQHVVTAEPVAMPGTREGQPQQDPGGRNDLSRVWTLQRAAERLGLGVRSLEMAAPALGCPPPLLPAKAPKLGDGEEREGQDCGFTPISNPCSWEEGFMSLCCAYPGRLCVTEEGLGR